MSDVRVEEADAELLTRWDQLLLTGRHPTMFQTRLWAEYMESYVNAKMRFLVARDSDRAPAGLLVLAIEGVFARPLVGGGTKALIQDGLRLLLPEAGWQYGPVVLPGADPVAVHAAFAEFAQEARLGRMAFGKCSLPYVPEDSPEAAAYRDRGFTVSSWGTFLVRLDASEEDLWAALRPAARKAVRRAQRDNVTVRRAETMEDLRAYHALTAEVKRHRGTWCPPVLEWELMWAHMRPSGAVEVFLAYQGDDLLSGLGIWRFGNLIYEFSSNQSVESVERKLYGNDAIKWEVLRWGRESGMASYDLMGVAPEGQRKAKEDNIHQFKKKWGGEYVPYAMVSRPGRGGVHWVASSLRRYVRQRRQGGHP